jgi:hypothetical protein
VTELTRYDYADADFVTEVARTLRELSERGCIALELRGGAMRYALAPRGSERLACLAERSELASVTA